MKIPARAPPTKQAQRPRVSPGPQVPLRGLAYEVGALGTQPGRSPPHCMAQERLTIHTYETLCSLETRPRRHRTSVSSGTGSLRPSGRCDACPKVGDRRRNDAAVPIAGGCERCAGRRASGPPWCVSCLREDALDAFRKERGRSGCSGERLEVFPALCTERRRGEAVPVSEGLFDLGDVARLSWLS